MLRNLLRRLRVIASARASSPSIPFFYGTLPSSPPPYRTSDEHLEDGDEDDSGGVTRPSASTISSTVPVSTIYEFRDGPISVAEYTEEVLTNLRVGFCMNRDVFGAGGDFVTSPEVSQMFGEMIGVWSMCLWGQMGQESKPG